MTKIQMLDYTYGVKDDLFGICYHQCTRCGIIFGCEVARKTDVCGNPFYHGRCNICSGTNKVPM